MEQQERRPIKIGAKGIEVYLTSVMYEFEIYETIEVSAIGSNINKMYRIISLLKPYGIAVLEKKYIIIEPNLRALVLKLRRNAYAEDAEK